MDSPAEFVTMASLILLLLLNTHRALCLSSVGCGDEEDLVDDGLLLDFPESVALDVNAVSRTASMHFSLWNALSVLDDDLGYWVKPRSTTWFSKFLLEEYDDDRWVQMFRMTKQSVFSLAELLTPFIKKKDTKYRLAIPVIVRLACTLFKLSHGASLLICNEMFAVGRSTVSIMLRQVVHNINVVLRSEISWPCGQRVAAIAADFEELCGLPGVVGAIDGTQIAIARPKFGSADYFYFKSGAFTMNCQAVVDSSKRFLDLFVGMPGSTNDSRMLRRSTLFYRGQQNSLWDNQNTFHGFAPYLLGDAGYPLLPWLMVPHRREGGLPLLNALFNRKLSKGRPVVENAFALLKLTFIELHQKSDLSVTFLPDVVICCALMHNLLLQQSHEEVERLLHVLNSEGLQQPSNEAAPDVAHEAVPQEDNIDMPAGQVKRQELGLHLAMQRIVPT